MNKLYSFLIILLVSRNLHGSMNIHQLNQRDKKLKNGQKQLLDQLVGEGFQEKMQKRKKIIQKKIEYSLKSNPEAKKLQDDKTNDTSQQLQNRAKIHNLRKKYEKEAREEIAVEVGGVVGKLMDVQDRLIKTLQEDHQIREQMIKESEEDIRRYCEMEERQLKKEEKLRREMMRTLDDEILSGVEQREEESNNTSWFSWEKIVIGVGVLAIGGVYKFYNPILQ